MLIHNFAMYGILLAAVTASVLFYARHFERSNLFFPSRYLEHTPLEAGLYYEEVEIPVPGGITLHGWFIPYRDARGTILFCHGNAGNMGDRLDILRVLREPGFNVMFFDYRGYGKSTGVPSEKGMYEDAAAVYGYLEARPDVDKDMLIIYGKSLGGAVAAYLAADTGPKALVLDSAFTSTIDMGRQMYPYLPLKWLITMKYDTVSHVGKVTSPVLVIHSREDEVVPFAHGERIFAAVRSVKDICEMTGGHNDAITENPGRYVSCLKRFLADKCGIGRQEDENAG